MPIEISRVLLLDNVDPAAREILERNGIKADICREKFTSSQLITRLKQYDGVVVRSATKVTSEVIEGCPDLKIIGRAGTGVDNIDVKAATKRGVAVMNTPGGNTISAAEHTCTLICCLARNVPAADAHVKAGKWDRKLFMGHELLGKVLAIVGLGRIGLEVAERMQSFGMRTIGYDPMVSAESARTHQIEWMELDQIWPQCDYVTVHTPLIPQTRGLINSKVFATCKPGIRVVNCARGGIIDEDCLLKALESGACGGAALDVFLDEPTKNTPLVSHSKVIACPHLGASTKEGQARCGHEIAMQLVQAHKGKSYFGIINAPALTASVSSAASLWSAVGKNLGIIMNEYMKSSPKYNLAVCTSGPVLAGMGKYMKAAVCCGLVGSRESNVINAAMLAEDLGIKIIVDHATDKADSLTLKVSTETDMIQLEGGIVNDVPVLLGVNGKTFSSPVKLSGSLLIFKAESSPSKFSEVISTLAANGVMPSVVSVAAPCNGSMWTALDLKNAISSTEIVQAIVDKAFLVIF